MSDQTPDEMRETAKRLRKRLETEGGTYGSRSDIRAGADALDRLAEIGESRMSGQVVTLALEDGEEALAASCNMESCDCPEHEVAPPPRGIYITIHLDEENTPVGLWRVRVVRDES